MCIVYSVGKCFYAKKLNITYMFVISINYDINVITLILLSWACAAEVNLNISILINFLKFNKYKLRFNKF